MIVRKGKAKIKMIPLPVDHEHGKLYDEGYLIISEPEPGTTWEGVFTKNEILAIYNAVYMEIPRMKK